MRPADKPCWYQIIDKELYSRGALKQGPCTCIMIKSFLVISANVPCMYYVQPEAASKRTNIPREGVIIDDDKTTLFNVTKRRQGDAG